MIQSIGVYIITSILGIIIGILSAKIKSMNAKHKAKEDAEAKKNDAILDAVIYLASEAYFTTCHSLLDKEEISEEEFEELTNKYKAYKGLGLNGTGTKLYNQISQKPIR